MRTEISRLHERLGTTFIYVTHDQVEAMTMGTRIVVMKDGFIQQIDTPVNLYKYPDNMFVAGFIGTPQMNFFDGVVRKEQDDVVFALDCGINVDMKYIQADKVPLKYMDGNHKIVFGIRPDDVRIKTSDNDPMWADAKAVVSVVEVLGGEALIYANLNLDTIDAEQGAIIIKADPDTNVHRGDVIDIQISRRKFHVFDKETKKSIRKRIPDENIVKCEIKDHKLIFENLEFELPNAIKCNDAQNVEMSFPTTSLTLGSGCGKAKVEWIEKIEGTILYFLKVNGLTLFSISKEEQKYQIGDEVNFDIDLSTITIEECNIQKVETINKLNGNFIRVKNTKGEYNFYMKTHDAKLKPSERICEKLFACKGPKIFNTNLRYEFNLYDAQVALANEENSKNHLVGEVLEIIDYGKIKFARIQIGTEEIKGIYNGSVGDKVSVEIDVDKITIIDSAIDIIIV